MFRGVLFPVSRWESKIVPGLTWLEGINLLAAPASYRWSWNSSVSGVSLVSVTSITTRDTLWAWRCIGSWYARLSGRPNGTSTTLGRKKMGDKRRFGKKEVRGRGKGDERKLRRGIERGE